MNDQDNTYSSETKREEISYGKDKIDSQYGSETEQPIYTSPEIDSYSEGKPRRIILKAKVIDD